MILVLTMAVGCSREGGSSGSRSNADSISRKDTAATAGIPPQVALTYEQRQGKYLFMKYCVVCHGTEGKGDGFNAYNLDPRPRDLSDSVYMSALSDDRILQTVSGGGRSMNKSPFMPSWGGRISKEDLAYLVIYVRSLSARR
jgi:mono/diheme cytochrome c family protein